MPTTAQEFRNFGRHAFARYRVRSGSRMARPVTGIAPPRSNGQQRCRVVTARPNGHAQDQRPGGHHPCAHPDQSEQRVRLDAHIDGARRDGDEELVEYLRKSRAADPEQADLGKATLRTRLVGI
jgi:hypothetical protein